MPNSLLKHFSDGLSNDLPDNLTGSVKVTLPNQSVETTLNLEQHEINQQPYQRVQLFSGGGWRFGYYLGSYACLYEHGLKPDLILASCGGSLSALLVDITPEPKELYQLSQSRQLYDVIMSCQSTRQSMPQPTRQSMPQPTCQSARLKPSHFVASKMASSIFIRLKSNIHRPHYILNGLKRWRLSRLKDKALEQHHSETYQDLLDELQQLHLFEIKNDTDWLTELIKLKQSKQFVSPSDKTPNPSSPLQPLTPSDGLFETEFKPAASKTVDSAIKATAPEIAILASRLFPSSADQTSPKLQQLLFASPNTIDQLTCKASHSPVVLCPTYPYAPHRLLPTVKLVNIEQHGIAKAVRASIADMYYLKPIKMETLGWCLGGVIDLTPIELACQLGQKVFAETKATYDTVLAVPAIQRVFGFDPNIRLQAVHNFTPPAGSDIHWLPFSDNGKALAAQHIGKRINLRRRNIDLIHPDYFGFKTQMQAQWDYGYQRTLQYIDKTDALKT